MNQILFWMFFLPLVGMKLLDHLLQSLLTLSYSYGPLSREFIGFVVTYAAIALLLSLPILWGEACLLTVGRKLVDQKAGRPTTSFAALRRQTIRLVGPLLLTEILYYCFAFYWLLALIVPGMLFLVRSSLYAMIVVYEDRPYNDALHRSRELIYGRTWQILLALLSLAALLLLPVFLIEMTAQWLMTSSTSVILLDILSAAGYAMVYGLFLLSLSQIYGELKKLPPLAHTFQLAR